MKRSFEGKAQHQSKKYGTKSDSKREVTTVLVKNLPKSYNKAKVRKYFQECGNTVQIDVSESLDKSYRLARIQFERYDEAITALTKTFKKIGQNEIEVSLLENCTIWITNFPPAYTVREIKELLQGVGVAVLSVRLPSLRYNSDRRFAYIDVSSTEDVAVVTRELNGKNLEGYKLVAKKSNPLEKLQRTDYGAADRREIMVRHLDVVLLNEDYLQHHFAKVGDIESVSIPPDQENSSSGYGFVTFKDQSAAKAALEICDLEGKPVQVVLADRKAFIERQKVKRIINSRISDDRIVALYPLSDKASKLQIEKILLERAVSTRDEISEVLLVPDKRAAFVSFREPKLAAKCMISLNKFEFQKKILHCGTVKDLLRREDTKSSRRILVNGANSNEKSSSKAPDNGKKLSNEDFRKMFLNK